MLSNLKKHVLSTTTTVEMKTMNDLVEWLTSELAKVLGFTKSNIRLYRHAPKIKYNWPKNEFSEHPRSWEIWRFSETPAKGFRGRSALRKFLGSKEHADWLKIELNAASIITVQLLNESHIYSVKAQSQAGNIWVKDIMKTKKSQSRKIRILWKIQQRVLGPGESAAGVT